ncbi:hypothetical protein Ddye_012456 [Dipteronia dyeriana]|uniref:Uncharacterized protein n=1 Tax=Dipteronia dyeriana TaxID=168575 RepID=A0AAE0CIN4_9ROSI|nr:hypothetical protein Ddye_012456 [Dipteronia dyeriana]
MEDGEETYDDDDHGGDLVMVPLQSLVGERIDTDLRQKEGFLIVLSHMMIPDKAKRGAATLSRFKAYEGSLHNI